MLVLFTYALLTHLRYGSGYVWLQTVEDLRDFRLPALTHKPKGSDGRFLDGSEGRPIKMSVSVGHCVSLADADLRQAPLGAHFLF